MAAVVAGDAEQPGTEGSPGVVALEPAARPQEDLRGGVLGRRAGPEQAPTDPGNIGLVAAEELREGRRVAGLRLAL